jgi:predicted component of type VI protein secretion system
MPENGSIQEVWTEIRRLARRVKVIDPDMASLLNERRMFQQLLASLPSAYDIVRNAIDGQRETDTDILL